MTSLRLSLQCGDQSVKCSRNVDTRKERRLLMLRSQSTCSSNGLNTSRHNLCLQSRASWHVRVSSLLLKHFVELRCVFPPYSCIQKFLLYLLEVGILRRLRHACTQAPSIVLLCWLFWTPPLNQIKHLVQTKGPYIP